MDIKAKISETATLECYETVTGSHVCMIDDGRFERICVESLESGQDAINKATKEYRAAARVLMLRDRAIKAAKTRAKNRLIGMGLL